MGADISDGVGIGGEIVGDVGFVFMFGGEMVEVVDGSTVGMLATGQGAAIITSHEDSLPIPQHGFHFHLADLHYFDVLG